MMRTRNRVAFIAVALALPALVLAQAPPPPRQNPSVAVGGKKVSVEYGQPSLNSRSAGIAYRTRSSKLRSIVWAAEALNAPSATVSTSNNTSGV